ncbi:protein FAM124B isoform X2 [Clinocottus analis]|uniref:protein FAM124B isoform X2 n=1 Tax=Clinocottus analis TaxID=304258 RepID=UPI0035C2450F
MSSSGIQFMTTRVRQQRPQQQLLLMNLHLLANPGDSLLLQHTLDRLLRWLCPSLCIFHVSERASPFRSYTSLCSVSGYPSLAITFFLHEAYGEERILKVLDFFQRPPWQYHHTESGGSRTGGAYISSSSPANAMLRPYLLPSRDFYSLGAGMPVWGVRPVHCGGEILRVTLYSAYDNYEDAVRLYETVLQRQAEEQKTGFCWFTLHTEPGLCLQLALKQLSPGFRVEPCSSAVLQFSVEEIGQLVPLLPNPCTPISTTRWQTEDLDGNKILFQVKTPAQPQRPLTCAFPLTCPSVSPRGMQLRSSGQGHSPSPCSLTTPLPWQTHRQGHRPRSDSVLEKLHGGGGVTESQGSGSCCSTPPEEEPETNVDTGVPVPLHADAAVKIIARSSSMDLLLTLHSERPAAVGGLVKELIECLPRTHMHPQVTSRAWGSTGCTDVASKGCGSRTVAAGQSPSKGPFVENRTPAELPSARTKNEEPVDEFFI